MLSWGSSSAHSHLDMEGGTRNVVIAPFDIEDVLTPVSQLVGNTVLALPLVLHMDLVTGSLWAVYSNKKNIVARSVAVNREGVLLANHGS